jgi:CSLREA domain-containing protein
VGRALAVAAAVLALALVAAGAAQRAAAADRTFTVNVPADTDDANPDDGLCADANGACSLRAAVEQANTLSGTTAIMVPAGTYTLLEGELSLSGNVEIVGAGARTTTIDQESGQRALEIASGTTVVSGVTIANGRTILDGNENNAGVGGGAYVDGSATLDLTGVTVRDNTAESSGGGIDSNGSLNVVDSTIADNTADGSGGNHIGGGIDDFGSALTITNSTIADNTATAQGGGVLAASDATLVNDTIADNTSGSGGGVFVYGSSTVTTVNTILAYDTGGECNAALASQGNNIAVDSSCSLTGAGDLQAEDPLLGSLRNNGGDTDTLAPRAGSPALGAANSAFCPPADQIGTARPAGHCDIGSLQLTTVTAPPPPPPPPPALPVPAVGAPAVSGVTDAAATVGDAINPNGSPTFYVVRWGTTTAYGLQTGAYAAGSGTSAQSVSVTLQGLAPGTTYHVQVVATNPGGTAASADATFTTTGTGPATAPPPPVQGQSFDVAPFSGTVLVNGRPLVAGTQIPFGSTIDATKGTVTLISIGPTGQLQTASFTGAVFQVVQAVDGSTELVLTGGNFGVCTAKKARHTTAFEANPKPKGSAKANTTVVRSLWGNGTGQFTTKGRYAAATVRGTVWHTSDRCDGTNVTAATGVIAVHDLVTGKTIILTAPASYLAHP